MTATTPETTVETLPYKNPDLPASEHRRPALPHDP